jgi:hypothetical protein
MKEQFDVQDVIDAGCTLEPLVCRSCQSTKVMFNQAIGDAYCATCGHWQLGLTKPNQLRS